MRQVEGKNSKAQSLLAKRFSETPKVSKTRKVKPKQVPKTKERHWDVEKIVGIRKVKITEGLYPEISYEFLVKWTGFNETENSWQGQKAFQSKMGLEELINDHIKEIKPESSKFQKEIALEALNHLLGHKRNSKIEKENCEMRSKCDMETNMSLFNSGREENQSQQRAFEEIENTDSPENNSNSGCLQRGSELVDFDSAPLFQSNQMFIESISQREYPKRKLGRVYTIGSKVYCEVIEVRRETKQVPMEELRKHPELFQKFEAEMVKLFEKNQAHIDIINQEFS